MITTQACQELSCTFRVENIFMEENYLQSLRQMQQWFDIGATKSVDFRLKYLALMKKAIYANKEALFNALYDDLKKNREEAWITELGFVLSAISTMEKNLKRWAKPERVKTNLLNFPSSSYIYKEPFGVVLIIAPWNYPFQLLFTPFIGAIAAGNCVVLKPSEYAPATAMVMKKMIREVFPENYVSYLEGDGAAILPPMLKNFRFNKIFYTGSTQVGKYIYQLAAAQLVPVVLELGGKSPCIIEEDAQLEIAAKRIVQAKFSNAGQMCVAPDYMLVQENIKEALLSYFKKYMHEFFEAHGPDNYDYGKIINLKNFERLAKFLQEGEIIYGGKTNKEKLYIQPTLLENVSLESELMREEIFGPLLPVITFKNKDEALAILAQNPHPLAFYVFTSKNENEKFWIEKISFGGGCINNAAWHLTNDALPFGGIGNSGTGNYHGVYSFETFTHKKSIMKTPTWFDPAIKYPPLKGKLKWIKKVFG